MSPPGPIEPVDAGAVAGGATGEGAGPLGAGGRRRPVRSLVAGGLVAVFAVVAVAGAIAIFEDLPTKKSRKNDIYFTWMDARRLVDGENPYSRVVGKDPSRNQKYSTYLPGFYLLAAATQVVGFRDYEDWLDVWRRIFMLAHLGVGAILFAAAYRRGSPALAVFASAFWLFNRWSLRIGAVAHLDTFALLPFVACLVLLRRRRTAALVLYGISLSLKQIGVFAGPVLIGWIAHEAWVAAAPGERGRATALEVLRSSAAIAAVPLVLSAPFLVWDAEGFVRSLAISVTRRAGGGSFNVPAFPRYLGWGGASSRLPMLGLVLVLGGAAAAGRVGPTAGSLLALATFLGFNSPLFFQYMVWTVPLLPLAALELTDPDAGPRGASGAGGRAPPAPVGPAP